MESKDYLLVGVCVVAALLLFVRMAKENKVFIGAGILCLLYGGYHVAQALCDTGIVSILGWILRGIAVIMLIWMFTVLSQERAKKNPLTEDDSTVTDDNAETVSEENTEENASEDAAEENPETEETANTDAE